MGRLEADLAVLKVNMPDERLYRWIRSLLICRLDLRRSRVMQSPVSDTSPELYEPVEEAFDNGVITDAQETRISTTDIILRAQRKADRSPVWVAVEVSNDISQRDIERVRQSADALSVVLQQDTMAVVAGYRLHSQDQERARKAEVVALVIGENG